MPTAPNQTPTAVASTPRSAQSPSALLDSAVSAMKDEKSVHISCTLYSSTGADMESEDIGVASGRVVNTQGSVSITDILVGGIAYNSTNTAGVWTVQGIPQAEAENLAGKWISIRPGDSYGHMDLNYARAVAGMTLASQADGLQMTGSLTSTAATLPQGVSVYGVTGSATSSYKVTAHTTETVYIAASGAPLPVNVTTHEGDSTVETCNFSQWGEPLNITAPANAVPLTSIPQ